jgi:hypothetical protein
MEGSSEMGTSATDLGIVVGLDGSSSSKSAVRWAAHEARMRNVPLMARYLEGYLGAVQLIVIGTEDVRRVPQLVGPQGLPIFAHADCSVLVVWGQTPMTDMSRPPGSLHTCC